MGDIADSILDGDFDEETGEYIGPGDGYPRSLARETREGKQFNKPLQTMLDSLEYIQALGVIQNKLIQSGYIITIIKRLDYGTQLRLSTGGIVNLYTSGKVNVQGKPDEKLINLFT